MDRLWLIGLLGWVVRCIHACGEDVVSRFSRLFDSQYPSATFENSQITRVSTNGVEI